MKKGLAFGISNFAIYASFFLIVIVVFLMFKFDHDTKAEVFEERLADVSAETVFRGYLRQNVSADVDGDGQADAETVADLLVLSQDEEDARRLWETHARSMLSKINSDSTQYRIHVVYPDGENFYIPKPVEGVGKDFARVMHLPLESGDFISVYVEGVTSDQRQEEIEEVKRRIDPESPI